MLVTLLSVSLALAADPESASGAGEVAPAATSTESTSVPATPPPATDASAPPTAPAAPVPAATPVAVETPSAPLAPVQDAPAAPFQPTVAQRRAYRTGRILANAGIVALPVGIIGFGAGFTIGGELTPFQRTAGDIGAVGLISALPLVWSGVALERSAIRRAGCRPGGDGWRYAPLVPLAIGAIRAVDDSEEIALGIAGAWAVLGVQHVVLQPSAKRCGLRGRPQP